MTDTKSDPGVPRQSMQADIVCVGFGPASAGFLKTLAGGLMKQDGTPIAESKVMPGLPPQVICYERSEDIAFGVSGVVTEGRAISESITDFSSAGFPTCAAVSEERVVYLTDPAGASRRPLAMRMVDPILKGEHHAFELPWIPPFLRKEPGFVFSIGQFLHWVGQEVMASGMAQIWPASPVGGALVEDGEVTGVRLVDQGVSPAGKPAAGYMPGMDIQADLTVVADGPYGPVGMQLDDHFGMPKGHHKRDWALGMKAVVQLPGKSGLKPGTVIHTIGYPEPELFGFMYVLPDGLASLGIFVPSWFKSPIRTGYRYLQHWMMHPYLWRFLEGGTLRSWGAKSLAESGRAGEPYLVGDGYARIGEGSGSTNVLKNSGVDEAWATGVMLAEAVLELMREDKPYTKENLEASYVNRRRSSWLEDEARKAQDARNSFHFGTIAGLTGMGLAGLTGLKLPGKVRKPSEHVPSLAEYFGSRIPEPELKQLTAANHGKGETLHDVLMTRAGWPEIPFDGKLLVSHQDALLMGGKVQAPAGYADHVIFLKPEFCAGCESIICAEACSGQAITPNPSGGSPLFDREKCIHCGACIWNCSVDSPNKAGIGNVEFLAGTGGLRSAEN